MSIDVRRAGERFRTSTDWLDSRHSFSFGPYYDPANVGFGVLMVHNDEVVAPGTGFGTHPHQDLEIVTWVVRGALVHQDSEGHSGVVYPGLAQRMSAGSGIRHSEKNDAGEPVRYVQMWVRPDELDLTPSYQQAEVDVSLATGELVPIASGLPEHARDTAIRINQRAAGLSVARLVPGAWVQLPAAPYVHLFVAVGSVALEGAGDLGTADAVRLTNSEGRRVTAGADGAEILVWEMRS
ncbi:Pirin domain protein [Kribbella flavida DSM 17836]|uniref:Pirin domain protein n=1 Tax=Kribbella flavida (strain DSM 17836 / JCM 10339 / NBRC 14399) TaxID=479435 RepID=D2Q2I2_KRIFD|nr:pirin family protein [Kribbella flavida]ADB35878.1 Pirin domain protein [Kribbella flavida DSM 17836]